MEGGTAYRNLAIVPATDMRDYCPKESEEGIYCVESKIENSY